LGSARGFAVVRVDGGGVEGASWGWRAVRRHRFALDRSRPLKSGRRSLSAGSVAGGCLSGGAADAKCLGCRGGMKRDDDGDCARRGDEPGQEQDGSPDDDDGGGSHDGGEAAAVASPHGQASDHGPGRRLERGLLVGRGCVELGFGLRGKLGRGIG